MSNRNSKILSVRAVISYCDGPIVFSAMDGVGCLYICSVIASDEAKTHYLCAPISKNRLDSFLSGKVDLRSLYEHPEVDEFYELMTTDSEDSDLTATLASEGFVTEEILPEAGYIITDFIVDDPLAKN